MRIQQNYIAINAQRIKAINDNKTSKKINRLSSGYRINSAADDSAGLAISEKMRLQILGMNQAARNVLDGISLVQTVDGALQTITDIVQRMRELAVQSASDTNQTDIDRLALDAEYQQLKEEIDEIVSGTTFNGVTPLAGEQMQPVMYTLWSGDKVSDPEIFVYEEYTGPTVAEANVNGITETLAQRGTVSGVSTTATSSVNGTVGSVGTVIAITDITDVAGASGITNLTAISVSGTTGTAVSASGSLLEITGTGTYAISASAMIANGVTNINVVSGAKLIITGDLTDSLTITGGGEVKIIGNSMGLDIGTDCRVQVTGSVTGDVKNSGSLGVAAITGDVTNDASGIMTATSVDGNVTNNGQLTVTGDVTGIVVNNNYMTLVNALNNVTNTGKMSVSGSAAGAVINSGQMTMASASGSISNSGTMTVSGNASGTVTNNSSGEIKLGSASGTVTNNGRMTVTGNASGTVTNNNYMTLGSASGASASVINNSGARILIKGAVTQIDNKSGATADLLNAAGASITNSGKMELSKTSALTNVTNSGSSAEIRVSNDGTGVTIASNTGLVDSYCTNTRVTINSNKLRVSGTYAVITDNIGDMVVTGNYAAIEDNNGNMDVSGSSGTIEKNHSYMVVSGDSNTILTNNSGMLITGSYNKIEGNSSNILATDTATGTIVNGNSSNIEIRGSSAIVNVNSGNVYISGVSARIYGNDGNIQVNGEHANVHDNSKNILLTGENAIIHDNHGDIEARAQYATIHDNGSYTNIGNILITGDNAIINDNHGDIEVRAQYATIHDNGKNTNIGNILITGNNATVNHNHGSIVVNADNVVVNENSYGGDIYSNRTLEVVRNLGRALLIANNIIVGTNGGHMIINGNDSVIDTNNSAGKLEVNGTNTKVTANAGDLEVNGNNMWIVSNSGRAYALSENARVDSNSGGLEIDGNNATVTNTATGSSLITGNDANVTNYGLSHVVGDGMTLTNHNGARARVEGDNADVSLNGTGSRLDIDGNNSTIADNRGSAEVDGNNTVIGNTSGYVRLEKDNNAKINANSGRIEVSDESKITSLGTQTGTILVEDGGEIDDSTCINDGRIEVSVGAEITINTNNGTVLSKGISTIDKNTGYIEVGEWEGDDKTPADGSLTGKVTLELNYGGIIRNFSNALQVTKNESSPILITDFPGCICMEMDSDKTIVGGIIENYGTMNEDCDNVAGPGMQGLKAEIYHHARQVDVSEIGLSGTSTIIYYANGKEIKYQGEWQSVLGGESGDQLFFDVRKLDKGTICYSAGDTYEVAGTTYDIEERREVNGSIGTSGLTLMYKIGSGFQIQSGANTSDTIGIDMTILSTEALGSMPDNCGCVNCMCTLGTTNIKIQHTAICAIENCDQALNEISEYRGKLGSYQNRLEFKLQGLEINAENLTATESRIRDSDMAKESTELMKSQMLGQASTAMILQANTLPQAVLTLLG